MDSEKESITKKQRIEMNLSINVEKKTHKIL